MSDYSDKDLVAIRSSFQKCFKEYGEHQEKYAIKGFNLFEALAGDKDKRFDHTYEHLHSKVLHFLLDPEEGHNQKNKFLQKFMEFLEIDPRNYENPRVTREKYNIDVLIEDKKDKTCHHHRK